MKKDESNTDMNNYEGQIDPFDEPRTIPGQWDVSAFQSLPKPTPNGQVNEEIGTQRSSHVDSETQIKGSEPSGIKYLDPDFDAAPANGKCSAY